MSNKNLVKTLCTFLLFFGAAELHAKTSELENFVAQAVLERTVAGVSIARIENGQIVEEFAISHPDIDGEAITPQTVFQVGSISKPIAAWAVMTLVRDGKVDLDASISDYVSRWQLPDSEFELNKVTIRRLLSHTAGLSLHGYPGFLEDQPLPSIEESLSGKTGGAGGVFLALKPGEQFQYSGGGFTLLQLMVEEVTGMSFSEYAKQSVMTPLGMLSSSYAPDGDLKANRAVPYAQLKSIQHIHFRAQAAASLNSTAGDLARFALANLDGNPVLSAQLVEQMHAGETEIGSNKVGLGFFIEPAAGLVGHSGANQGWRASLTFAPENRSGLVVLTNSDNAGFFIHQIRCYWEENFSKGALREPCAKQINAYEQRVKWLSIAAWTLLILGVVLLIWRLLSIRAGKTKMGLPNAKRWWLLLILCAGTLVIGSVLLNTVYGAFLISGFSTQLTALDYFPEGAADVYRSMQVLLACVMLFTFVRSTHRT